MSILVGTGPDQVPVNGMLGNLAFQNKEYINIDNAYVSGNVGIGTLSPSKRLHVESGSTAGGGQVWSHSSGTIYARLNVVNPGTLNDTEFGTVSNNALVLLTNNTEKARIDANGNVGIGTGTTVNQKLEVSGSSASSIIYTRISNTANGNNGMGTGLQFYGWDAGITANIKSLREGQSYSPSYLSFETYGGNGSTNANALAERMRIDGYGNVGIGTSSPSTKFHVQAGAAVSTPRGTTSTRVFFTADSTSVGGNRFEFQTPSTSSTDLLFSSASTGAYGMIQYDNSVQKLSLYINSSAKFYIDTDGRVSTPHLRLDTRIGVDDMIMFSQQRFIESDSTGLTINSGTATFSTFVNTNTVKAPYDKALSFAAYYEGYVDEYVPVKPGEIVYVEIWAYRANGATGTAGALYVGLQQYDKDKKVITGNLGLQYQVTATVPTTGVWTKYSGYYTIPSSHTAYNGSDGGPVAYVRPHLIVNYSTGTITTLLSGLLVRKTALTRDSGTVSIGNVSPTLAYALEVNGDIGTTNGVAIMNSTAFPSVPASMNTSNGNFAIGGSTSNYISFGTSNAASNAWVERMRFGNKATQGSSYINMYEPTTFSSTATFNSSVTFTQPVTLTTTTNAAGIKTFAVTASTTAGGDAGSTYQYELMRISRDSANWSSQIGYEITVYNSYYRGGVSKWFINYNQVDGGSVICAYAAGTMMHKVSLGTEVVVSGTIDYRPVIIDLVAHSSVSIEVKYSTTSVAVISAARQVFFTGTYTQVAAALHSGDTHLVPSGGNLGVGTLSPLTKLHIADGNSNGAYLTLDNTSAIAHSVGIDFKINYNNSYSTSKINFDFFGDYTGSTSHGMNYISGRSGFSNHWFRKSDNTALMVITDAGNVGINTGESASTVSAKLDVRGTTIIRTSDATAANNAGVLISNVASATSASRYASITLDPNGANGVDTDYTNIGMYGSGEFELNNQLSAGFITLKTNAIERMRIDSNGNVGIGSTNADAKLVVKGAGTTGLKMVARFGQNSTTVGDGIIIGLGAEGSTWSKTGIGYVRTNSYDVGDITFYTNSTNTSGGDVVAADERMRITSAGRVGIGTTSPAFVFEVKSSSGSVGVSNSGSIGSQLVFKDSSGNSTAYIQNNGGSNEILHINAAPASGLLAFETVSVERMRIDNVGNVGIGTYTPSYKLHVNGSFAATTKSFVIDHPTKEGMKLRYGSLEGPENGVYIRGRLKDNNIIELPEYWTKLVDPDSITVNLTPIGSHQKLFVKDITDNTVIVGNDDLFGKSINCFYTVFGERADVEKLEVEI